ncbi:MAG: GNAT family N-acetyltransferase [Rhodospirillales bacterium]|jgi:GNAT superfamily N-acetyltransferase|nr:GNAT family N-acetyltransferase [Rhodospirillales bacterium]MBT4041775.1 GNAT family N-acetyltransferase [Rhodospirillales bacterium]MBT4628495.1 GNAT family N-acetyltransferase [Rhodospirillales bacterium]MBT5351754.1 GNAT family N-acetyltransferase [Rhodospirillales bacterium]MBT5521543.1 GNAT family N-acetyltransferase [Rhodospirillales bacterium]
MIGIHSAQGRIRKPYYSSAIVMLAGDEQTPVVRRLTEQDLPAIQTHLLSLDSSDRDRRFNSCMNDMAIIRYTRSLDLSRMIFSGAFDLKSGQIIGLAEAHLDHAFAPAVAEISICVLPEFRGRNMGADLLSHLFQVIAQCGVREATFYFEPSNQAMVRTLKLFNNSEMSEHGFSTVHLSEQAGAEAISELGHKMAA